MFRYLPIAALITTALGVTSVTAQPGPRTGSPTNASQTALNLTAHETKDTPVDLRGWGYLVERLRRDGVAETTLQAIYADPRMPFLGHVPFAVAPRESKRIYAPLKRPEKIALARDFLATFASTFDEVENHFKVHRSVIAAILLVETHFGQNTGRHLVINRLSRVAAVGEPTNLLLNHRRLLKKDRAVTLDQVKARAEYLEQTFYPEVLALIRIIERDKIDPFSLHGSIAGAFGLPQFLPSSYLRYGFDGNRDGTVSLFDPHDAIWSVGHYLAGSGWRDDDSQTNHRAVIWKYNRSDPYIDTILSIAASLRTPPAKKGRPRKSARTHSPESPAAQHLPPTET